MAPTAFDSATVKSSFVSTVESPLTEMVNVRVNSPAAKVIVPLGNVPPKSAASAGVPPRPLTVKSADASPLVSPVRVTVKVNGVVPLFPSSLLASASRDRQRRTVRESWLRIVETPGTDVGHCVQAS